MQLISVYAACMYCRQHGFQWGKQNDLNSKQYLEHYDLNIAYYLFKWRWMKNCPINYGMNLSMSFYNMQMILPRTNGDG